MRVNRDIIMKWALALCLLAALISASASEKPEKPLQGVFKGA